MKKARRVIQGVYASMLLAASIALFSSRGFATERPNDGASSSRGTAADEQAERAEQQYERGVEAFGAKRYLEAVDFFSRANTLRPDSRLHFNIGLAFDRAGDVSSALANYRSYLFAERTSEHTARVTARVTELERELAKTGVQQVTIRSTPSQAHVTIDGREVGVTPWTGDLKPGIYRVTLQHSGFESSRLEFSLSLKAALTLSAVLEPLQNTGDKIMPGDAARNTAIPLRARHEDAHQNVLSNGASGAATDEPTESPRVLPWILMGSGAAFGLAALGFELDRRDAVSDAKTASSRPAFDDNVDRMQRDQTLARVFGGVGLTGIAAGVVWWLATKNNAAEAPPDDWAFDCAPHGCSAGVRF